jgi:hypothetical protein
MTAPSLITSRRFSHPTRLRLQIVFARAWEALAETYQAQATDFVRRLRSRLPIDEALDRYFREVGVPAAMEQTVRARALVALSPLAGDSLEPESRLGWTALRPDQVLDALRRRAHFVEETNLECRLAASRSDEAVTTTHVRMAIETVELLQEEISPDEAIMHYIRSFHLPSIEAQIIYRRALAQWAERGAVEAVEQVAALAVCARAPELSFATPAILGLRVAG